MAEKKKNNKKEVKKSNTIKTSNSVKESAKKDAQVSLKTKKIKKEKKFKTWFNNLSINTIMVFGICVILLTKYKWDPILVMLLAGVMNTICYFI